MSVRRTAAALVLAIGAAAATSAILTLPRSADIRSDWREVTWPFPLDPWEPGRAFRCAVEACGVGTLVTIRAKIGFCNCTTGVADDDEIDRVGDLAAISETYGPAG